MSISVWRHLRWSLYRNKIFGSPCPLWCRSPWRSTDGILHQRRTRYNRLFAYKLPHSPFLYWRAESWKSHQWNCWIKVECIFKPERWQKKRNPGFWESFIFCCWRIMWQWLQSLQTKRHVFMSWTDLHGCESGSSVVLAGDSTKLVINKRSNFKEKYCTCAIITCTWFENSSWL